MNVFEFREKLVSDYSDFTRSFTRIKARDIKYFVDREYDSQKYWPAPLIQVNPNFRQGKTVQQLVDAGVLHPVCSKIFRHGKSKESAGISLSLFQHQQEAIGFAQAGVSYVLTTGTGSGKSLALLTPVEN